MSADRLEFGDHGEQDDTFEPLEVEVACGLCGAPTINDATKRCDRCWELERRMERDPEIALRIFTNLRRGDGGPLWALDLVVSVCRLVQRVYGFRNPGEVFAFIESAVEEALRQQSGPTQTSGRPAVYSGTEADKRAMEDAIDAYAAEKTTANWWAMIDRITAWREWLAKTGGPDGDHR